MDEIIDALVDVLYVLGIDVCAVAKQNGNAMPSPYLMLAETDSGESERQSLIDIVNDANLNGVFWAEIQSRGLSQKVIDYIENYLMAISNKSIPDITVIETVGERVSLDGVDIQKRYDRSIMVVLFFMTLSYTKNCEGE